MGRYALAKVIVRLHTNQPSTGALSMARANSDEDGDCVFAKPNPPRIQHHIDRYRRRKTVLLLDSSGLGFGGAMLSVLRPLCGAMLGCGGAML